MGVCSRREAENLILDQQIKVGDQVAQIGDRVNLGDRIFWGKKSWEVGKKQPKKILLAFFKPAGVETSWRKNSKEKNLNDFRWPTRVFNIGRLDRDSRGLLLLTNDGELCQKIAHPSFGCEKEYLVEVDQNLTPEILRKLAGGSLQIEKNSVRKNVAKCRVKKISAKKFQIILTEGQNRQIRKMCAQCGLHVLDLLRTRVGEYEIGDLKLGEFAELAFW